MKLTTYQQRQIIEHYAQDAVGRSLNHMGRHQLRYIHGAEDRVRSDGLGTDGGVFGESTSTEVLYKMAERAGSDMVHLLAIAAWKADGCPNVWE